MAGAQVMVIQKHGHLFGCFRMKVQDHRVRGLGASIQNGAAESGRKCLKELHGRKGSAAFFQQQPCMPGRGEKRHLAMQCGHDQLVAGAGVIDAMSVRT